MNIVDVSGYSSWLFARIDAVVTVVILMIFGCMAYVMNNLNVLIVLLVITVTGMIGMTVVSFGYERLQLGTVAWLLAQSFCLYLAYLTFQTIFFDRFIACFRIRGNVGFFIALNDFLGYTGTVLVLLGKELFNPETDWACFYNRMAGYVGVICCIAFILSLVYLYRRSQGLALLAGVKGVIMRFAPSPDSS